MYGRRGRTVSVLAVAGLMAGGGSAVVAGAAGATSPPAHTVAAGRATPDVTLLFGRALAKTRATRTPLFAKALVYEADGSTANGKPTNAATGITKWRFVFQNSGSKFATATLTYGPPPKRFGRVVGIKSPFLEDVVIPRAPKMTLAAAVARLRKVGIKGSFTAVTMRRPLGPKQVNTLYLFTLSNGTFVSVDTVTGKVSRLRG